MGTPPNSASRVVLRLLGLAWGALWLAQASIAAEPATAPTVTPAPTTSEAAPADDAYALAAGFYARQQWKLASEAFGEFLAAYPEHPKTPRARFFMSESQMQLGDWATARQGFVAFLDAHPEHEIARQARFRAAEARHLLGEDARVELGQFLAKYPGDPLLAYVLVYLGEEELRAGQTEAARRWFSQAKSDYPQSRLLPNARLGLARAQIKLGKADEAFGALNDVAKESDAALAEIALGELASLRYERGEYAEAAETFRQWARRFPQSAQYNKARLGEGWSLFQLGQFDAAERVLETVVSDVRLGAEARYWLAMCLKGQNDWARAADEFTRARDSLADGHLLSSAVWFHGSDALSQAGRADEAAQWRSELLKRWPESPWADDAALATVSYELSQGNAAEAARLADDFATRYPDSPHAATVRRLLGRARLAQGQYAEARAVFEPLVNDSAADGAEGATSAGDRYLLALAQQGQGDADAALATLAALQASEKTGALAESLLLEATLLRAAGQNAEAVERLEAFRKTQPAAPLLGRCLAQLALCQAALKNFAAARRAYDDFLATNPALDVHLSTAEQLAEAAFAAEDWQGAEVLFAELIQRADQDELRARASLGHAWCRMRAGHWREATDEFAAFLSAYPGHQLAAEAALARGQLLERLDRPDAALAQYRELISTWSEAPQAPIARLASARLHRRLGQEREAEALYAELVESPPADVGLDELLYEWSWSLRATQREADALAALQRLRDEFPRSRYRTDATYRLAQAALSTKNYAEAQQLSDELCSAETPDEIRPHALYLSGQVAVAQGRWSDVAAPLAELAKAYPANDLAPVAEYWQAEAEYRQGRFAEAGRRFEKLAVQVSGQTEPWTWMVSLRKAQVLALAKRWDEAEALAVQLAQEHPDFEQAFEVEYLLGRCLAARGMHDDARQHYRRVCRSSTGGKTETAALAQLMIGESFFHEQNYAAAVREYLAVEILYAYPELQASALLQAGKCYEQLGEWQQANTLYERIVGQFAETEARQEAARRQESLADRIKTDASG